MKKIRVIISYIQFKHKGSSNERIFKIFEFIK
jgi:hypothetical protein